VIFGLSSFKRCSRREASLFLLFSLGGVLFLIRGRSFLSVLGIEFSFLRVRHLQIMRHLLRMFRISGLRVFARIAILRIL